MNRTDKQTFVDNFREKVQDAPVLYLTDFSGLDVKSMTLLRQQLRTQGMQQGESQKGSDVEKEEHGHSRRAEQPRQGHGGEPAGDRGHLCGLVPA